MIKFFGLPKQALKLWLMLQAGLAQAENNAPPIYPLPLAQSLPTEEADRKNIVNWPEISAPNYSVKPLKTPFCFYSLLTEFSGFRQSNLLPLDPFYYLHTQRSSGEVLLEARLYYGVFRTLNQYAFVQLAGRTEAEQRYDHFAAGLKFYGASAWSIAMGIYLPVQSYFRFDKCLSKCDIPLLAGVEVARHHAHWTIVGCMRSARPTEACSLNLFDRFYNKIQSLHAFESHPSFDHFSAQSFLFKEDLHVLQSELDVPLYLHKWTRYAFAFVVELLHFKTAIGTNDFFYRNKKTEEIEALRQSFYRQYDSVSCGLQFSPWPYCRYLRLSFSAIFSRRKLADEKRYRVNPLNYRVTLSYNTVLVKNDLTTKKARSSWFYRPMRLGIWEPKALAYVIKETPLWSAPFRLCTLKEPIDE